MTFLNHAAPRTQEQRPTILHALNRAVARGDNHSGRTQPRCGEGGPSHVVEAARARVPSPGPVAAPGCSCHFCIS
jgi:hypothetical protein